jgi:hypothetical protein
MALFKFGALEERVTYKSAIRNLQSATTSGCLKKRIRSLMLRPALQLSSGKFTEPSVVMCAKMHYQLYSK